MGYMPIYWFASPAPPRWHWWSWGQFGAIAYMIWATLGRYATSYRFLVIILIVLAYVTDLRRKFENFLKKSSKMRHWLLLGICLNNLNYTFSYDILEIIFNFYDIHLPIYKVKNIEIGYITQNLCLPLLYISKWNTYWLGIFWWNT